MAKFLNTSATNYFLEEMIKSAADRLILISPFLKLNDRMKELLADKNRLKIDVRIVYGKSELQPKETEWLSGLTYIRTSFCKNLHAKCYMNENMCIVTSLNLYEFSQVNNNERASSSCAMKTASFTRTPTRKPSASSALATRFAYHLNAWLSRPKRPTATTTGRQKRQARKASWLPRKSRKSWV